jgi:hypothetical protein
MVDAQTYLTMKECIKGINFLSFCRRQSQGMVEQGHGIFRLLAEYVWAEHGQKMCCEIDQTSRIFTVSRLSPSFVHAHLAGSQALA